MGEAWEETEEPYPRAGQAHIRGASSEWRISLLGSLLTRRSAPLTDRLDRRRGPLLGFSLCVVLEWCTVKERRAARG